MWNLRLGVLACALAAVLCTACGGGGGGDGVSADLGGWWEVSRRPVGGIKPYEAFTIIQGDDAGSSFWVNGQEFTRTGSELVNIEPSAGDPDREVITLTIVNEDLLEGTLERYDGGSLDETYELRVVRRTAPTGSLTMTDSLTASSSTAYGAVDDGMAEFRFGVYHVVPYERETYVDVGSYDMDLEVRTYTVGTGAGTIEANVYVGEDGGDASAGTVTITMVGARLVGTFDLTYPGGHVAGSFDVDVLLDRLP